MKNQDKLFILFFVIASLLFLGIIAENVRSIKTAKIAIEEARDSKVIITKIDVDKVRAQIEKAGIVPREAKYWINIKSE